jgi:hypothetical protein
MTARTIFLAFLIPLSLVGCSSSSETGMKAEDERVWSAAREMHGVGALDDRTFDVRMGTPGKELVGKDTLEFAGGRFHSTACDGFGFGTALYTTKTLNGGLEFHAVCTNDAGDKNEWHGTVRGDDIAGGLTWTPKGSQPVESEFRGRAAGR